ncbi:hypothetical protein F5B22DRAFT_582374 [Xylaria bambusicola]|uniref:uncharacterized protein n=1 Tax=Xylaria bambusicola TaxID=326684 RepID=UPI002007D9FA|nr:uncharacterized protein F5B22DRAFT_582374 [Xylaria bambusicola]KAI0527794.1 hypothetical protein F5B22DRAFT_582374 [Xylaria bambusicola]
MRLLGRYPCTHIYNFLETDEWESHWLLFDVWFHLDQLHFRSRVEDEVQTAVRI